MSETPKQIAELTDVRVQLDEFEDSLIAQLREIRQLLIDNQVDNALHNLTVYLEILEKDYE